MNDMEILYWWIGIYWEVFKTNISYFMYGWAPPCDFTSGHYIFTILWFKNDIKMDNLAFFMTILYLIYNDVDYFFIDNLDIIRKWFTCDDWIGTIIKT